MSSKDWIVPDWPAPRRVRSLITTRSGGVSRAAYAQLNLAEHVGDDRLAVAENRRRLTEHIGVRPLWLNQVHGAHAVDALASAPPPAADSAYARAGGVACAVMTADCLPVLLCDRAGTVVAAAHAGWRGLLAGVLEQAVGALAVPGSELLAYLGPAIGAQAFEVGEEVRAAYTSRTPAAAAAFAARTPPLAQDVACSSTGPTAAASTSAKWLADIYLLARQALASVGVDNVYGDDYCTVRDESRFFSYRRDGATGRMASLIWLADE